MAIVFFLVVIVLVIKRDFEIAKVFFISVLDGNVSRIALEGNTDTLFEPATEIDFLAPNAAKWRSRRFVKKKLFPASRTLHRCQFGGAIGVGSH